MKTIKDNEYECASCGGVFKKGWSEGEAQNEAKETFGKPVEEWKDKAMIVCDDCYNQMLPSENPEAVKRAKEIL